MLKLGIHTLILSLVISSGALASVTDRAKIDERDKSVLSKEDLELTQEVKDHINNPDKAFAQDKAEKLARARLALMGKPVGILDSKLRDSKILDLGGRNKDITDIVRTLSPGQVSILNKIVAKAETEVAQKDQQRYSDAQKAVTNAKTAKEKALAERELSDVQTTINNEKMARSYALRQLSIFTSLFDEDQINHELIANQISDMFGAYDYQAFKNWTGFFFESTLVKLAAMHDSPMNNMSPAQAIKEGNILWLEHLKRTPEEAKKEAEDYIACEIGAAG